MKDQDLLNLVKLAGEAERFEAEASGTPILESRPSLRLVGAPMPSSRAPAMRSVMKIGGFMALAACLAVAAYVGFNPAPQTPHIAGPRHIDHVKFARGVTSDGTPCVVITIYADAAGALSCADLLPHELKRGRSIETVHAGQLAVEVGAVPCIERPAQMIALVVTGPVERLPSTHAEALLLASCLGDPALVCAEDPTSYTRQAVACLPTGLSVVANLVPM